MPPASRHPSFAHPTPSSQLFAPSPSRPFALLPLLAADIAYAGWYAAHNTVPAYLPLLAGLRAAVLATLLFTPRWRARAPLVLASTGATLIAAAWAICYQTMVRGPAVRLRFLAITCGISLLESLLVLLLVRLAPRFALRGPPPPASPLAPLPPAPRSPLSPGLIGRGAGEPLVPTPRSSPASFDLGPRLGQSLGLGYPREFRERGFGEGEGGGQADVEAGYTDGYGYEYEYECEDDDCEDCGEDDASSVSDSSIIDLPPAHLAPLDFGGSGIAGVVAGVGAGVGAAAGAAVDIASGAGALVRRSASARFLGRSVASEEGRGYGTFAPSG